MADLAAARGAHPAGFTDRVGREVVVQQEVGAVAAVQRVDELLVIAGAQRGDHEALGLAAGEQRRAVGAGQDADLGDDGPNGREVAPVDPAAVVEDVPANDFRLELLDAGVEVRIGELFLAERGLDRGLGVGDGVLAVELVADREGVAHRGLAGALHLGVERAVVGRREVERLLGGRLGHVDDHVDHRLHLLVAELDRAEHLGLRELVGLGLDHHHRVLGAGDDQVEPLLGVLAQLLHVVHGRVEHVGAIDEADAGAADRAEERRAGEGQRGRGGDHADHVGIVLHVVGEDGDDDLGLVLEALDEEGPDRTVDQAGGQDLLLGGTALALEEAAGDLARGIGLFLVVHGQREEVEALLRLLLVDDGGEHAGLAVGGDDGGIGLPGDLPRFERERVMAPLDGFLDDVEHISSFVSAGGPPGPAPCNAGGIARGPRLLVVRDDPSGSEGSGGRSAVSEASPAHRAAPKRSGAPPWARPIQVFVSGGCRGGRSGPDSGSRPCP